MSKGVVDLKSYRRGPPTSNQDTTNVYGGDDSSPQTHRNDTDEVDGDNQPYSNQIGDYGTSDTMVKI